jgi:HlyD family secretion protein
MTATAPNKRKRVIVAAIAVLLASAGVVAATRHRSGDPDVPTFHVTAGSFSRRVTAEGTLKAVNATPLTAPHDAPGMLKIAWIADEGALVRKDDVVVRFDPTDFQKQLILGSEDHTTASRNLGKSGVLATATRENLHRDAGQAQSELEAAKRFNFDDAEIFSRYQRIENEVDSKLAGDRKQHAEKVLGVRDTLARTELDLLNIEDRKAGIRIRNAEQGLRALEVRAPYDGLLVLQRDWRGDIPRIGSTCWPGMPIGEIPDLKAMKAEVFLLEADAAGLAADKKATVFLESNPGLLYPGKITGFDKLARPRIRNVPVQYFGVTVSFDKTDARAMKPGARVRAVLDLENLANAFSIPRQALFEKEGKKLVYVRRGGKFVPSEVTVATSSAGRVVVTKGLAAGDDIALVDPTEGKKDA